MTVLQSRRLAELSAVGFLAFAGAWLTADYLRMGSSPGGLTARAVLLVMAPFLAVGLSGLAIIQQTIRRGAVVLVVVTPFLGATVGALELGMSASRPITTSMLGQSAFDGMVAGFVFLPALLGLFWSSRNIGRARAGSMIDGADRRAPYVVLGLSVAIAVPIAAHGSDSAPWLAVPLLNSLAIGVVASTALLVTVVLDSLSFQRARAASLGWETLEPHDLEDELAPDAVVHDLGIGEDVVGRVGRADAYRSRERLQSRLHGEPSSALRVLRRATVRSSVAFLLSCATLAWGFSIADSVMRDSAHFAAAQLSPFKVAKPAERPDQLPLTCEAYFAMAGGCAERLTGSPRQEVSSDITRVREEWVSHRDRQGIEVSCDRALRFVLAQPSCISESRTLGR